MTEYKMLTPKLRREIFEDIDSLLDEVKTCEKNILTQMQFECLSTLKTMIGKLPDGYLMPMKEAKNDESREVR